MRTFKRGLLMLAILAGLGLTGSQAAWAKKHNDGGGQVDPTTITPCTSATTTLATSNIVYTLSTGFSTSFVGTCIKVTGNNDLIIIGPQATITGPGSATASIGIDITGTNDTINGRASTISSFGTAVLDAGTDTLGDNLDFTGNGVGLKMTGHTTKWVNLNSSSNTGSGVWFNGCQDTCVINDFFTGSNGGDGMLINGQSQGTVASVFISQDNTGYGVHVGQATGQGNGPTIIDDASLDSTLAVNNNGSDGVFLDVSEAGALDVVTGVDAENNSGIDMHDATTNCGSGAGHFNLWSSNFFGTSKAGATTSPVCIPLLPTE